MNNKNRKKPYSLMGWLKKNLNRFQEQSAKAKKYFEKPNGRKKSFFFLLVAASITTLLVVMVSFFSQTQTPKNVTDSTTTQPTPQLSNQPSGTASPSSTEPPAAQVPQWAKTTADFQPPIRQLTWSSNAITYSPSKKPSFQSNEKLTTVVEKVITLIKSRKLSTTNLSIALIDANNGKISEYNKDKLMFPASVAKMFWLVTLQGQTESNSWKNPDAFEPFINRMMKESDNDSSSFIIDSLTGSYTSKENTDGTTLNAWLKNREARINDYFIKAEYNPSINLTQKTYPIPYLDLSEPKGNELQIRSDPKKVGQLIRNRLTTFDAARLMYEICYQKQAISAKASTKICSLLEKQVDKSKWSKIKLDDFNPIQSFFGESLPSENVKFYSKAGWTPKSRSEVSMVEILDQKKSYILAVFADDPAFGKDKTIFPSISKLVYDEMRQINAK
jgi:beta-lactamase class A